MTEPTTPSPSRELIAKWRTEAERHKKHGDCYRVGQGWGLDQCADQLLAALAGETPAAQEWRCFHCGMVCRTEADARNHFGPTREDVPQCKVEAHPAYRDVHRRLRLAEMKSEHPAAYGAGTPAAQAPEKGCVCTFDDDLVQEWVSKVRAVAKAKGWLARG